MISRVWMINSILAIAFAICLMNIWDVWHTGTQVFPEKSNDVKEKVLKIKKIPKAKFLKASAYQNIVDKNLFSPDRAPAPPEDEPFAPEIKADVRVSGEKVVLYGVIMIDDFKKALINNPGDRKTGLKNRWVKVGEHIGNLEVRQIRQNEILLVDGSDNYRVSLYDPDKAAKLGRKSGAHREKEAKPNLITAGAKPKAVQEKKFKQTKNVTSSADDEYEVIETPFGTIKRKRR